MNTSTRTSSYPEVEDTVIFDSRAETQVPGPSPGPAHTLQFDPRIGVRTGDPYPEAVRQAQARHLAENRQEAVKALHMNPRTHGPFPPMSAEAFVWYMRGVTAVLGHDLPSPAQWVMLQGLLNSIPGAGIAPLKPCGCSEIKDSLARG